MTVSQQAMQADDSEENAYMDESVRRHLKERKNNDGINNNSKVHKR